MSSDGLLDRVREIKNDFDNDPNMLRRVAILEESMEDMRADISRLIESLPRRAKKKLPMPKKVKRA